MTGEEILIESGGESSPVAQHFRLRKTIDDNDSYRRIEKYEHEIEVEISRYLLPFRLS